MKKEILARLRKLEDRGFTPEMYRFALRHIEDDIEPPEFLRELVEKLKQMFKEIDEVMNPEPPESQSSEATFA